MADRLDAFRRQTAGGTFCIVTYCHPDYAWTHHREWHEERYAVSIAEALDLMAEHPDFRFCVEPWIDQIIPFLERCPERGEELAARLNSGQMGVLAFTVTSPRPATAADETFLRNMVYGREQYRALAPEVELSVMSCPDVGIGHSQLPQVLRLAGARLYRGWRSEAALSEKGVPREFVWRGLDGTEILVSRGAYGGMTQAADFQPWPPEDWDNFAEGMYRDQFHYALALTQARTWWVSQGMDDSRPLRGIWGDELMPLVEATHEWNQREPSRLVFATPQEYAARLGEEQAGLPVVEGVIDPVDVAYNSGWLGGRGLWRLRQQLDTAMVIAERACALAGARGMAAVGPEELGEMWWETIRVASHAQQWAFERDWQWLTTGARWNLRRIEETTARAVQALSGAGRRCGARRPLALFNPLPYARDEWLEVPWSQPRLEAGEPALYDETGAEAETQVGERIGQNFGEGLAEASAIFRARVPAMGVVTYEIGDRPRRAAPAAPEQDTLEVAGLTVRCSGRGLQEISDAETGIEWRAPEGSAIGDVRLYEMGYPQVLHVGPITAELSAAAGHGAWVLTGPWRWVYRWQGAFHGHMVQQDITLDAGRRYVDFLSRVYSVETTGFFALCLDLPISGELHADIPFGVEARDLSGEPWSLDMRESWMNIERYRRNQFWARSFASVSDGERGISVITADGDRYWTWDAQRRELRHILFTPVRDDMQDWEAWITKDRMALGWHEFRHRLLLHQGDWKAADVCGESDRLRTAIQVVRPLGPVGRGLVPRPPAGDQVLVTPSNVRLSAFYQAGEGYVVRVYESAGKETEAEVRLPFAVAEARKVDFNLEPLGGTTGVSPAEGGVRIPLRRWEIATILLRTG
jgi:hypothetical protein